MTERRYWDSDCFLGWLQDEGGKVAPCRQVLDLADRGGIEIVTSALTIAEVLRLRGRKPLPPGRREQVVGFFKRRYIVTMALTRRIAEDSRELVWDHGIFPKDAVHVASALAAGVRVFNTFDKRLIAKSGVVGHGSLSIETPTVAQAVLGV